MTILCTKTEPPFITQHCSLPLVDATEFTRELQHTYCHHTSTPGVMLWGTISFLARSHLVFMKRTLTSLPYVQDVMKPVLLPFFTQETWCFPKITPAHTPPALPNVSFRVSREKSSWRPRPKLL